MSNFDRSLGPPVTEEGGTANQVFATPNASKGFGTFRTLVSFDIPSSLNSTTFGGFVSVPDNNSFTTPAAAGGVGRISWGVLGSTSAINQLFACNALGSGYMVIYKAGVAGAVNGVAGQVLQMSFATGGTFTAPTGTTVVHTVNTSGDTGVLGTLAATQVKSSGPNGNGGTLGYCPPAFTAAGTITASTLHIVNDTITAPPGATTTVTFTNGAIFANANYNIYVINDTTLASVPPATKTASGFTFTSVAGTLYSFTCIGE